MQSPLYFVTRPTKNSKRFVISLPIQKPLEFQRETYYKLWRIDHPVLIDQINVAFKTIDSLYIADIIAVFFLVYSKTKQKINF